MSIERKGITLSEYNLIHQHIRKNYGKAPYCSNKECKNVNATKFQWALISGRKYSKNIDDYMPLCNSCHRIYDDTPQSRINKSISHLGINGHGKDSPVYQKSRDGGLIEKHNTIADATRKTGILGTSINNCLADRSKTAGGFLWEYVNKKVA